MNFSPLTAFSYNNTLNLSVTERKFHLLEMKIHKLEKKHIKYKHEKHLQHQKKMQAILLVKFLAFVILKKCNLIRIR